jgi:hypothetical protein
MMQKAAISTGKIVLYFVLMFAFVAGAAEYALPHLGLDLRGASGVPPIVVMGAVNFVGMAVPAVLMKLAMDRQSPMAMGFSPKGSIADFLSGSLAGVFIFTCALAAAFFGGWARFEPDVAQFSMTAMMASAAGMTLAAAGEEVMLRGYVLQELMSKFSTPVSVIVSSALFVALHIPQLIGSNMLAVAALNIFLASVLLSLAYLATRTLWLPIGIHAGWNFAQGPLAGINVSGADVASDWRPVVLDGPEMMTGGTIGLEGSVLGAIGPVLGILMMLVFKARKSA